MERTNNHYSDIRPDLAALDLGIVADSPQTKTCRTCGRTLPLTSFNKSWKSRDGHQHICRDCNRGVALANLDKAHAAIISRPGVKRALSLADFTDSQLAAEFSRRGYSGSITRTSTLSI